MAILASLPAIYSYDRARILVPRPSGLRLSLLESAAMWLIESTSESPETLLFRLLPGSIKTVGRAPRADFVVDAPLVSRLHCRLTLRPDGLLVEDLESTNGTFVNGARVAVGTLANGDTLRVGRMEFCVRRAES